MKKTFTILLLVAGVFGAGYAQDFRKVTEFRGLSADGDPGGSKLAVSSDGSIYQTNTFFFEMTIGKDTLLTKGSQDTYIAKHDKALNPIWAKQIGATGFANAGDITTDAHGNVYVAAMFQGYLTLGDTTYQSIGFHDIILIKYSSSGELLDHQWFGTTNGDYVAAIAVDTLNNVYIAGQNASHVIVTKFTADLAWVWSHRASGRGYSLAEDLKVAAPDDVYVCGNFSGGDVSFGRHTLPASTDQFTRDLFVARLNTTNASPDWNWALGSRNSGGGTYAHSLTLTPQGPAIAGMLMGRTTLGDHTMVNTRGTQSYLVAQLSHAGAVQWVRHSPDTRYADARSISSDAAGNLYATGLLDGPLPAGDTVIYGDGAFHSYVLKFKPLGDISWGIGLGVHDFRVTVWSEQVVIRPDGTVCAIGLVQGGEVVLGDTRIGDHDPQTINRYVAVLTSQNKLQVTSPNGGESYVAGGTVPVSWRSTGVSQVRADVSLDGGQTWSLIGMFPGSQTQWTIDPRYYGANCYLRVADASDPSTYDLSDRAFEIRRAPSALHLVSPNGGEALTSGETFNITWFTTDPDGKEAVKIYFSSNAYDPNAWQLIFADSLETARTSYAWVVPDVVSSNCKIRIQRYASSRAQDTSEDFFMIRKGPDNSFAPEHEVVLDVFPNPASDVLSVSYRGRADDRAASLQIYSAGQQREVSFSKAVMMNGTLHETVSLAGWNKGVYVLVLKVGAKMITRTFFKH